MAEELQTQEVGKVPRKRKIGHKKGKGNKKMKVFQGSGQKVKMDGKMKKLFRKKARDYNSDDSDDVNNDDVNDIDKEEPSPQMKVKEKQLDNENEEGDEKSSEEEVDTDEEAGNDISDDEDVEIQPGIMKFSEGCKSFKKAFKKIIKRSGSDDVLGPVLSAHKNLVVKKLAEEAAERKVKGDAKKEKTLVIYLELGIMYVSMYCEHAGSFADHLQLGFFLYIKLGEKGHVKPDAFSVPHEKLLIGVATKGVVKLFNAVNKAQSSQKVIQKRRKEAFFSELGKSAPGSSAMVSTSASAGDGEGPAWAPLRDNYMLTTSKLKDWDKAADAPEATEDFGGQEESSSDDD